MNERELMNTRCLQKNHMLKLLRSGRISWLGRLMFTLISLYPGDIKLAHQSFKFVALQLGSLHPPCVLV